MRTQRIGTPVSEQGSAEEAGPRASWWCEGGGRVLSRRPGAKHARAVLRPRVYGVNANDLLLRSLSLLMDLPIYYTRAEYIETVGERVVCRFQSYNIHPVLIGHGEQSLPQGYYLWASKHHFGW